MFARILTTTAAALSLCLACVPVDEAGEPLPLESAEQAVRFNSGLYVPPVLSGEWGVAHDIGSAFESHGLYTPGTGGGCSYDWNLALQQCRERWQCTQGVYYCVDTYVRSPRCSGANTDIDVDMECCGLQYCQICKCVGDEVEDRSLPVVPSQGG